MQTFIVLSAVLAVALAQFGGFPQNRYYPSSTVAPIRPVNINPIRPATSDQAANIVRYENDINPDGSYSYAFETDNGIGAQAQGTVRAVGGNPPEVAVAAAGSFSWTSPEGVPVSISYIADENGYQAQGDAIPTPHPIPEAILRSLEWIARNPSPQKK